jgi:hypothetical protein
MDSWNALKRVPCAAVAVKDLRPLRGAYPTRVLDRHPRCGCWLTMRSISLLLGSQPQLTTEEEGVDGQPAIPRTRYAQGYQFRQPS